MTMRFVLTASFVLFPFAAEAYIGPGAGLSALGTLAALAGALLVALFGVILFPIRILLRRLRRVGGTAFPDAPRPAAGTDS
jgi:uncharacterized membrane protein